MSVSVMKEATFMGTYPTDMDLRRGVPVLVFDKHGNMYSGKIVADSYNPLNVAGILIAPSEDPTITRLLQWYEFGRWRFIDGP